MKKVQKPPEKRNRLDMSELDILQDTLSQPSFKGNEKIGLPSTIKKSRVSPSRGDHLSPSGSDDYITVNILLKPNELTRLDSMVFKFKSEGFRKVSRSVIIRELIKTMEEGQLNKSIVAQINNSRTI